MSEALQVHGIVLSSMPIGESDKRIVLLTREIGKISAFARGARRPGSALMAGTGAFAFGRFSLIEGRSSHSLVQTAVDNYFYELAEDPLSACYGYYFLDFADYYGREGIEAAEMLNLLYLSLKALLHRNLDDRLVRRVYELRLMAINGEYAPHISALSEGAMYTVQYIIRSPLEKLYTFAVSPEILAELEKMLDGHMDRILDRPLRSRDVLEALLSAPTG